MKHDPDLKPDAPGVRPLSPAKAGHCEALLGKASQPIEVGVLADEFAAALAKELTSPMAELMGGAKPTITAAAARPVDASTCVDKDEPLAAHFLLGEVGAGNALIASVGANGALALCDRAFGGTGDVPDPLPEYLPMSADLTLGRLGECLAAAMSIALDSREIAVCERGAALAKLVPFGRIAECITIELSVEEEGCAPWTIGLLAEAGMLGAWLADCARQTSAGASGGSAETGRPTTRKSNPILDIPLPVTAVLGTCKLSLQRVARLKAGDIIPFSLRREVPLMIGAIDVAGGTVGTVDNQVALQISRTFQTKGKQP